MKNKKVVMAVCVFIFVLVAAFACAEPQTTCPVMKGNPINKNLYVDVNGKRIYVCCQGCVTAVRMNPEKYITQMEKDGVELESAPTEEE